MGKISSPGDGSSGPSPFGSQLVTQGSGVPPWGQTFQTNKQQRADRQDPCSIFLRGETNGKQMFPV